MSGAGRALRVTTLVAIAAVLLTGCTTSRTGGTSEVTAHQALLAGGVTSTRTEVGQFWFDVAPVGAAFGAPDLANVSLTKDVEVPVEYRKNGLEPATEYRYRACSRDTDGSSCGAVRTFTTPAAPSAAVSLGDSYISGEGGRWDGNSINAAGGRDGTDRAFTGTGYDTTLAYDPPSDTNGCHRSTVAEIRSAALPVNRTFNLACSGAATSNIFRAESGGAGQNGEAAQADQLAPVARDNDIDLVVLSIGGNDLGFAAIVTACVETYETLLTATCEESEGPGLAARFPQMRANVGKAIDEVRAVMAGLGYLRSQYRFVLQSYPSAIARGSELRVPEIDRVSRSTVDGCPVYDSDADWARDTVVNQIADSVRTVAEDRGVQFMDLRDLFQGREICSESTSLATPLEPPSGTTSEWARFLNVPQVVAQGTLEETFHPNAYGQRAIGRCLSLIYAQTGDFACHNTPGEGPAAVVLAPVD
ncbi:MAG: hypothetical protein JW895_07550 [Thermoleophilaceae bacterium]|nr:hypothetical protein [Thermoleophilaceae bacterium]